MMQIMDSIEEPVITPMGIAPGEPPPPPPVPPPMPNRPTPGAPSVRGPPPPVPEFAAAPASTWKDVSGVGLSAGASHDPEGLTKGSSKQGELFWFLSQACADDMVKGRTGDTPEAMLTTTAPSHGIHFSLESNWGPGDNMTCTHRFIFELPCSGMGPFTVNDESINEGSTTGAFMVVWTVTCFFKTEQNLKTFFPDMDGERPSGQPLSQTAIATLRGQTQGNPHEARVTGCHMCEPQVLRRRKHCITNGCAVADKFVVTYKTAGGMVTQLQFTMAHNIELDDSVLVMRNCNQQLVAVGKPMCRMEESINENASCAKHVNMASMRMQCADTLCQMSIQMADASNTVLKGERDAQVARLQRLNLKRMGVHVVTPLPMLNQDLEHVASNMRAQFVSGKRMEKSWEQPDAWHRVTGSPADITSSYWIDIKAPMSAVSGAAQ